MFLNDAWYIAAEPKELDQGPLARTILNQPLVLFRTEAGVAAALEDRCPHRLIPLSMGRVLGENIRCAYHGARFAGNGACVAVPGQTVIPASARVRSYPVVLRHGYYWVWPGDPRKSVDESSIPDGYWRSDDTGWMGSYGRFESMKVDYRLLNDNVIDITHAEFVHPESFGGQEVHFFRSARRGTGFQDRAMTYEIGERSLTRRSAKRWR